MDIVSKSINELRGKPCWGLKWDCQLNISMNFGDPVLTVDEPRKSKSKMRSVRELFARRLVTVRGRWWLWLQVAHWTIDINGTRLADGSSSFRRISMALAKLKGQILTRATIDAQTGATRFDFDLGGVLTIRRYRRYPDDELWMLYKPNGYVLTIRGDGKYIHQPGSGIDKRRGTGFKVIPRRDVFFTK